MHVWLSSKAIILILSAYAVVDPGRASKRSQRPGVSASRQIQVKKPYKEQWIMPNKTERTAEIDQLNEKCPLPLNSDSREIGCLCDFNTNWVRCIYSDRLLRMPRFAKAKRDELNWSVDMRCKNLSELVGFGSLLYMAHVDRLDFSSFSSLDEQISNCKLSHSLTANNRTLKRLRTIDLSIDALQPPPSDLEDKMNSSRRFKINSLLFDNNNIRAIRLLKRKASRVVGDDFLFNANNLSLSNNSIESFTLSEHADICLMRLRSLNISYNRLTQLDVSFLIFLKSIDASHNKISAILVDYFNIESEPLRYACENIYFSSTTSNDNSSATKSVGIYRSALSRLDMSFNNILNLPFIYLKNIHFVNMAHLNISYNQLSYLNASEFAHMNKLRVLSLKGNNIKSIDESSFEYLSNLKELDLALNSIVNLAANSNKYFKSQNHSMISLYLSSNKLNRVPREALRTCASLKFLVRIKLIILIKFK
jgi:Leucine-rich repeat (LRR) protein